MRIRTIEFSGPALRPLRKWIVGFAFLAVCASILALGLSRVDPDWLQSLGWAVSLLVLFEGSALILWRKFRSGRMRFGDLGYLPANCVRWIVDEPEAAKKPNSDKQCT